MKKYYCEYCKQDLFFEKPQGFAGHKSTCKSNPATLERIIRRNETVRSKAGRKKKSEAAYSRHKRITFKQNCPKCNTEFELTVTENSYTKGKYRKFCSRACANSRNHTAEIKNRLADHLRSIDKSKQRKRYGKDNHNWIERTTSNCQNCGKEMEHKITQKKKFCSSQCSGEFNGGFNGKYKKTYKGMSFDSSWEIKVAKSLDENNIEWKRGGMTLPWIDDIGKDHNYYPDFYLPKYDVYLDPKNDYLAGLDKRKIELVEEQNKVKVLILNKRNLTWNNIKQLIENVIHGGYSVTI